MQGERSTGGGKRSRAGSGAVAIAIVTALGFGFAPDPSGAAGTVGQKLTPTASAPAARGTAKLKLRAGGEARFVVSAARLGAGKSFDVVVDGIKVGTLETRSSGGGRARFATRPRRNSAMLGFDPRGARLNLREARSGDDVLVGELPADDPGNVACCVADDDEEEFECEDVTADECIAAGGTVKDADSCLPDPCATNPPPSGHIVCCTNETHDDESEAECEDVDTTADGADQGGAVGDAASCDPNPCATTEPPDATACCMPRDHDDDHGWKRGREHGRGGDRHGDDDDGDDDGDDGDRDDDDGDCGDDDGPGAECDVTSIAACVAAGGTPVASPTCDPDPCAGSPSGAFLDGAALF